MPTIILFHGFNTSKNNFIFLEENEKLIKYNLIKELEKNMSSL